MSLSEIFLLLRAFYLAQVFRTMTFGVRPRRVTDAQVYFWQAANTGVRSIVPTHSKSDCAA